MQAHITLERILKDAQTCLTTHLCGKFYVEGGVLSDGVNDASISHMQESDYIAYGSLLPLIMHCQA